MRVLRFEVGYGGLEGFDAMSLFHEDALVLFQRLLEVFVPRCFLEKLRGEYRRGKGGMLFVMLPQRSARRVLSGQRNVIGEHIS